LAAHAEVSRERRPKNVKARGPRTKKVLIGTSNAYHNETQVVFQKKRIVRKGGRGVIRKETQNRRGKREKKGKALYNHGRKKLNLRERNCVTYFKGKEILMKREVQNGRKRCPTGQTSFSKRGHTPATEAPNRPVYEQKDG